MKKIIKAVLAEHFENNPLLRNITIREPWLDSMATDIIAKFRVEKWFLDLSEPHITAHRGEEEDDLIEIQDSTDDGPYIHLNDKGFMIEDTPKMKYIPGSEEIDGMYTGDEVKEWEEILKK